MMRFACFSTALALALATVAPTDAATLQTYTIAVGGQAMLIPPFGCSTGGPPAAAGDFFASAGVGGGAGVPTDGLATCGVAGGFNAKTATTGPLNDARSLATVFNGGANSFTGSASTTAQYGKVGAEAHATASGPGNSFIYYGAEAQAIARDTFTITSPSVANGTAGQIVYSITVDGSISAVGAGTSLIDVVYEQNGGPNFFLVRGTLDPFTTFIFTSSVPGPGLAGFTQTNIPGVSQSVSGSGEFDTFVLDFVYGTPFDFNLGLRAWVAPGISTNDVDFHSTALLTGIDVFVGGLAVTDFVVASGSGTRYDANGVHFDPAAVSEPGMLALLCGGLLGMRLSGRRRLG
jgi:hypothetical protein